MKRWKLVSGISLVFILGVLVGALGSGYYFKERQLGMKRDPSLRTDFIVKRLSRRLDLDENQKQKVRAVVDRMQKNRHAMMLEHEKKIIKIREEGFGEIRKELTPAQQEKMDRLREEFEKRRKKRSEIRGMK